MFDWKRNEGEQPDLPKDTKIDVKVSSGRVFSGYVVRDFYWGFFSLGGDNITEWRRHLSKLDREKMLEAENV
jgi:hypothetical protein